MFDGINEERKIRKSYIKKVFKQKFSLLELKMNCVKVKFQVGKEAEKYRKLKERKKRKTEIAFSHFLILDSILKRQLT